MLLYADIVALILLLTCQQGIQHIAAVVFYQFSWELVSGPSAYLHCLFYHLFFQVSLMVQSLEVTLLG